MQQPNAEIHRAGILGISIHASIVSLIERCGVLRLVDTVQAIKEDYQPTNDEGCDHDATDLGDGYQEGATVEVNTLNATAGTVQFVQKQENMDAKKCDQIDNFQAKRRVRRTPKAKGEVTANVTAKECVHYV